MSSGMQHRLIAKKKSASLIDRFEYISGLDHTDQR